MGNSSSKEPKEPSRPQNTIRRASGQQNVPSQSSQQPAAPTSTDRLVGQIYTTRVARGSRPDLPFLGLVRDRDGASAPERPRETKQEREARKLEKERQARLKERERSMREEGVDGGYLVTLGTYTGPEDFNKGIVRQLQVRHVL